MAVTMSVDGFDTSTIGFDVWDWTAREMPERSWTSVKPPRRHDRILSSDLPEYGLRSLEVEGKLSGTSESNFYSRRDELAARLDGEDEVRLVFSDKSDRQFYGRLTELSFDRLTKALTTRDEIELVFDLLRPFAYATDLSAVAFDSTAVVVPLGTAPTTDHVLRLYGSFTDPSVKLRRAGLFHYQPAAGLIPSGSTFTRASTATYQDASGRLRTAASGDIRDDHYVDGGNDATRAQDTSGTVLQQLDFTLSKAAGEWVEIDFGAGTIVDDAGTSQQSARDTGTDFPWDLDPQAGRHEQSTWPMIEVSSGQGEIVYRKAYL